MEMSKIPTKLAPHPEPLLDFYVFIFFLMMVTSCWNRWGFVLAGECTGCLRCVFTTWGFHRRGQRSSRTFLSASIHLLPCKDISFSLHSSWTVWSWQMESSLSLCVFGSDAHSKQLAASLNQHVDVVAAADGLVDLLRGIHLCSVYLHHDVSRNHSSSKINGRAKFSQCHSTKITDHSCSWFVCWPVGRRAHDHSVNQDAVRHLWEGWISQL